MQTTNPINCLLLLNFDLTTYIVIRSSVNYPRPAPGLAMWQPGFDFRSIHWPANSFVLQGVDKLVAAFLWARRMKNGDVMKLAY